MNKLWSEVMHVEKKKFTIKFELGKRTIIFHSIKISCYLEIIFEEKSNLARTDLLISDFRVEVPIYFRHGCESKP